MRFKRWPDRPLTFLHVFFCFRLMILPVCDLGADAVAGSRLAVGATLRAGSLSGEGEVLLLCPRRARLKSRSSSSIYT